MPCTGRRDPASAAEPSNPRPATLVASVLPMATPSTSQPTPQRLAAIREQLSLLSDYL